MSCRMLACVVWVLAACSSGSPELAAIALRDGAVGVADGGRAMACDASCSLLKDTGAQRGLDAGSGRPAGSVPQSDGSVGPLGDAATGVLPAQPRSVVWARRFGADGIQGARGVIADKDGTVLIAGTVEGSMVLAGTELGAETGRAAYVARLDAEGTPLWATGFPVTDTAYLRGLALDAAGAIYVTGAFKGTFTADRTLTSELEATFDIVVVKLNSAGTTQWSVNVGGRGDDRAQGIAVDPQGRVTVVGTPGVNATIPLPTGDIAPASSRYRNALVLHFEADGTPLWGRIFGGSGNDVAMAAATDAAGNIVVGGQTSGRVDFGSGPQTSSGAWDLYLSQYSESGTHNWVQWANGDSNTLSLVRALAFDGQELVAAGMLDGPTTVGGQAFEDSGAGDAVILRLLQDGTLKWGRVLGGPDRQENASHLGVDAEGQVYVAGVYSGAATDFGGGVLPADGTSFVMLLDAEGRHLWSDGFNLPSAAMAVAADGAITLVGTFVDTVSPGGHTLESVGGGDIYVVRL